MHPAECLISETSEDILITVGIGSLH